eukprot:18742-Heterococcus_DN1.PRE.2
MAAGAYTKLSKGKDKKKEPEQLKPKENKKKQKDKKGKQPAQPPPQIVSVAPRASTSELVLALAAFLVCDRMQTPPTSREAFIEAASHYARKSQAFAWESWDSTKQGWQSLGLAAERQMLKTPAGHLAPSGEVAVAVLGTLIAISVAWFCFRSPRAPRMIKQKKHTAKSSPAQQLLQAAEQEAAAAACSTDDFDNGRDEQQQQQQQRGSSSSPTRRARPSVSPLRIDSATAVQQQPGSNHS